MAKEIRYYLCNSRREVLYQYGCFTSLETAEIKFRTILYPPPPAIAQYVASEPLRKKYKVQQALILIGWALLLSFRVRTRISNFAA